MSVPFPRGAGPDDPALVRALLVFDFDGTLAPIVDQPDRAAMRPRTRALLARLARRQPVAILSGRARRDVRARLRGVPARHVIGCHGAEWASRRPPAAGRRRLRAWSQRLRARLAGASGVVVEDKRYAIALHYRAAPAPAAARRRILAVVAALPGRPAVTGGKRVVNLGLPGFDKAAALARLRVLYPGRALVFCGDDDNDEPAFAAGLQGLVTIRVGRRAASRAAYHVRDQRHIDAVLAALLRATARDMTRPART